jgi:hypothetical protein
MPVLISRAWAAEICMIFDRAYIGGVVLEEDYLDIVNVSTLANAHGES